MRRLYLGFFASKHSFKIDTSLRRVLASTSVWAQQPRAGEPPVLPIPGSPASLAIQAGGELVSR